MKRILLAETRALPSSPRRVLYPESANVTQKRVSASTICMSFHSDESVEVLFNEHPNSFRSCVNGGLQVPQAGIQILVRGIRVDGGQEELWVELL